MKGSYILFFILLLGMLEMARGDVRVGSDLGVEMVTHLHFFFHDTTSGKNETAFQIAQANLTVTSPFRFGSLVMIDDMLTDRGGDPGSKEIGRAQRMYGLAGLQEMNLHMTLTYSFTSDVFAGSSISVVGRNPVLHNVREMPVVGGTGAFRFARGYALAHTAYLSFDTAVVEYNVTVIHRALTKHDHQHHG